MKMVKQRHVVNLLEVLMSRTKIFIVLELVTGAGGVCRRALGRVGCRTSRPWPPGAEHTSAASCPAFSADVALKPQRASAPWG